MSTKTHPTEEFIEDEQQRPHDSSLPLPLVKDSLEVEDEEFSAHEQRKIIRRVDRRLLIMCGFLFAICVLDRAQLGVAAVAGRRTSMLKDLNLGEGNRYSVALLIFFVPYVVCQLPGVSIIRIIGPRKHLPSLALAWGVCCGFIHNYRELYGLRALLGVLEAGLFPGIVYLLSTWYTRCAQTVFDLLLGLYLASSFNGVLGWIFSRMAGLAGLGPWRWIFIMEGIITCLIGLVSYLVLVDLPNQAHKSWRFLTDREAAFIIRRINRDRNDAETEPFVLTTFFRPMLDVKIWAFALIQCFATTVAYAISFFLPLILQAQMGYSYGVSQLLSTPPPFCAGFVMLAEGWLSDKYRYRSPVVAFNSTMCIVGLSLLGWTHSPGVQYFGVFLLNSGSQANIPAVLAWQANNIRGQWKRVFCSASIITFGGIGGIIGSLVFRSQDSPRYLPGVWASIACNLLTLLIVAFLFIFFSHQNKRAAVGLVVLEGLPGFQYTL
ncbi:hypothetical protein CLAIMM_04250 [Cladophialophora immunda]|nr:hypothetical protein CLAIMM_04250 [Cladophialophora immunda]